MNNYEAVAYACMALRELRKEDKEIDESVLRGRMLYLMDMNTEKGIWEKYEKGK